MPQQEKMMNTPQSTTDYTVVKNGVSLDISMTDPRWCKGADADGGIMQTVAQAVLWAYDNSPPVHERQIQDHPQVEISVLLTNDKDIQHLNRDHRTINAATNVLAFALLDHDKGDAMPAVDGMPLALGDIVLAYETVYRESQQYQKSMTAHVTHLAIHGTLHLMGYDHINPHDAQVMENLETQLLAQLGIDDPYCDSC